MAQREVTIVIKATDAYTVTLDQYNRKMRESVENTRKAGQSTSELGNTVRGFVTAAALWKGVEFAGEMYELGTAANAVDARFRELTDTIAPYPELMQRLRDATLGVVDDLTLQQGATRMVQLANIDSAESLEKLMGIVVKTKQPQESLNEAVEKYARLLSSGSVQLLDNYGLSLSDVREETQRLMRANQELTQSEARTQAIINLSEENVRDLGNAANVASTSVGRLGVVWENFKQDVAQTFSSGVENMGQGVEKVLGIHPDQISEAERRAAEYAEAMSLDVFPIMDEIFSRQVNNFDPAFMGSFITRAIMAAENDPSLAHNTSRLADKVLSDMVFAGETSPFDKYNFSNGLPNREYRDLAADVVELLALQDQERDNAGAIADQNQRIRDLAAEHADEAERTAAAYAAVREAIPVDAARQAAEHAREMQEALADMSLSELFGEGGGGRLGSLSDMVAGAMEELGKSAELVHNFRSNMDLLSGRDTRSEQVVRDFIAPTIASTANNSPAIAQAMTQNLSQILDEAFLQGINVNAPAFTDALVQAFNGADFQLIDPQQFIDSLDPAAEIAGSFVGMAEDGSIIRDTMQYWGEQAPTIAENMGMVESSLGGAVTHTDKLKTNLDEMSSKKYVVEIEPRFVNIPGLAFMLFPEIFRMIGQAVEGNGGRMPGSSIAASRSGPFVVP